jgi:hypothetical protein
MSYLTLAATVILVLTPVTIPVSIAVAQAISDRRHMRWVARQAAGAACTTGTSMPLPLHQGLRQPYIGRPDAR